MEQLSLENATATNKKLIEQAEASRLDVVRMQQAQLDKAADHDRQIKALNCVIDEFEEKLERETMNIRKELSRQFLSNSMAQKETIDLMTEFDKGIIVVATPRSNLDLPTYLLRDN